MSNRGFIDYYAVLGIDLTDDSSKISRAYRKKALKYHPDKNPNNKAAADQFLLLSQAYEVLSDEKKKKAFDAIIKAKILNSQRNKAMDDKRRKLKEQLEQSEQMAFTFENHVQSERDAKRMYENAIKRLRAESSMLILQQKDKLTKSETHLKQLSNTDKADESWSIKLNWKCHCNSKSYKECVLDANLLKKLCKHASNVIVSKNKSMAIVEFLTEKNAFDCYSNLKKNIENILHGHTVSITTLRDLSCVPVVSAPTIPSSPFGSSLEDLEDIILSKFTNSNSKQ